MIVPPIYSLQQKLKQAKIGKEKAEALYRFLTNLDIPQKIEGRATDVKKKESFKKQESTSRYGKQFSTYLISLLK